MVAYIGSCNSRSVEPGGGHIEGYPHPQVKRELGGTKMDLQDAKGKLSQASKGDQQGVPSHINFCSNHDPPSAEEVAQSCSYRCTLGLERSI